MIHLLLLLALEGGLKKNIISEAIQRNVWVETDNTNASGVIIQTDIVLTCFHVLSVDSDIRVDGNEARIIAVDPKLDLVLLRTHTKKVDPVKWNVKPELTDLVFYVANTNGHKSYLSVGRLTFQDDNLYYTDTTAVEGASGGGLYDLDGQLVGLNEAQEFHVIAKHIKARVILSFLEANKEKLK